MEFDLGLGLRKDFRRYFGGGMLARGYGGRRWHWWWQAEAQAATVDASGIRVEGSGYGQ